MIGVKLQDGQGTSNVAKVSDNGILAVGQLSPSSSNTQTMDVVGAPFNLVVPKSGQKFIVTGLIINGTRSVSVNGARIQVFSAPAVDSAVIITAGVTLDVNRNETIVLIPIEIEIPAGVIINATTDSATVNLTVLGYYANAN